MGRDSEGMEHGVIMEYSTIYAALLECHSKKFLAFPMRYCTILGETKIKLKIKIKRNFKME
jgi:hypothetical protein